jgi:branched-chain amino acid transport system substrate-binding protein
LLFCNSYAKNQEVKIGILIPQTGRFASIGWRGEQGIRLAVDQWNRSHPHFQIKPFYKDSESSLVGAAYANQLILNEKVSIIIGDMTSTGTLAIAAVAEEHHIPMITPTATNDFITQNKKYIFRSCFVDSQQAFVLAQHIHSVLNLKKILILKEKGSSYSEGIVDHFLSYAKKNHAFQVKVISYEQGQNDFGVGEILHRICYGFTKHLQSSSQVLGLLGKF